MTLSKYEADAIRVIVDLPEDGWGGLEWDTFLVARGRLAQSLGRHDRIQERQDERRRQGTSRKAAVRKESAKLRAARPVVLRRSGGYCEANTPDCPPGAHQAQHVHHKRGKRYEEPSDLLHVCFAAHHYIHCNPEQSYRIGWMEKRL